MEADKIKLVLDRVTDTFSRLDMAGWFACFHQPHIIVTKHGNVAAANLTECEQLMGPVFERLREQKFTKSLLDHYGVQMLSNTSAVASAVWSRWDSEDKLIEKFGATYFFSKIDNRWGISLLTSHSADAILIR